MFTAQVRRVPRYGSGLVFAEKAAFPLDKDFLPPGRDGAVAFLAFAVGEIVFGPLKAGDRLLVLADFATELLPLSPRVKAGGNILPKEGRKRIIRNCAIIFL